MPPKKEECICPCSPDYISSYWLSPTCTVPGNIIEFHTSYGYNCKKLFNLCLIDDDTLVFSSGNFIHFYSISKKEIKLRRSSSGLGIGFILVNPNPEFNYLTIAENGKSPDVLIYKYPEMTIIAILKDGAIKCYTCACYSPNGELLATQSGEPDFMLTIWNWSTSTIILRTLSFQNDVLKVLFSPWNPILLTTCGLGHIKFWKMSSTFTGLKLQGDLGRFGKTEICDIYAVFPLADEKVISGCEWGNMLLWDNGLINKEICRRNRKPCHTAPITLITIEEGEVMTAGMDGYVRIWYWDTVELADPPDDDRFVEIDPSYEFYIGDKKDYCEIRCLVKKEPTNHKDAHYYVQDGRGGIWYCDLNKDGIPEEPIKLFFCHGGEIIAAESSPISYHFLTLGADRRLMFYNYNSLELVYIKEFENTGTDLIWVLTTIDSSGLVIFISFADGCIRQYVVVYDQKRREVDHIRLIAVIKPHKKKITKISISSNNKVLVSGSEDNTLFIHKIQKVGDYIDLYPIGFVELVGVVSAITWKDISNTILIGTFSGEVIEFNVPLEQSENVSFTYLLPNVTQKMFKFKTVKSEIRFKLKVEATIIRKEKKKQRKLRDIKRMKEDNPAVQIDIASFLEDSSEEEDDAPLYFPPNPNPILWLRYTKDNLIWINLSGYDNGYIYEIDFNQPTKPVRSTMIHDGDDSNIYSYLYIKDYLIWAVDNGQIRINRVKEDFRDLTNYYIIGMHDNVVSNVPKIFIDKGCDYIFTIGHDSNIFTYKWNGPRVPKPKADVVTKYMYVDNIDDVDDLSYPTLEETKLQMERNRKLKISNDRKNKILNIIAGHRKKYKALLERNNEMPISQQFTAGDLEIDTRVTEDILSNLKSELQLVRRKLEFDIEKSITGKKKVMKYYIEPLEHIQFQVKGIKNQIVVKSFRVKKLDSYFENLKKDIEEKLNNKKLETRLSALLEQPPSEDVVMPDLPEETFFLGLKSEEIVPKFGLQMSRLLKHYRSRKLRNLQRTVEWEKLRNKKPDPKKNHPQDDKAIDQAEKTIGDYKLKTDPEYVPPATSNTLDKLKELTRAREKLFELKNSFNLKLLNIRERKKKLYKLIAEKKLYLEKIHKYIPKNERKFIMELPEINVDTEYPEEYLLERAKCGTGLEVDDILQMARLSSFFSNDSKLKTEKTFRKKQNAFQVMQPEVLKVKTVDYLPNFSELMEIIGDNTQLKSTDLLKLHKQNVASYWELELRYRFIYDQISSQHELLYDVNQRILELDEELKKLSDSKLQTEIDAKFLELYIIVLNQELLILRDCEQVENKLLGITFAALNNRNLCQNVINSYTKQIDEIKRNVEKMNEQIRQINIQYLQIIKGNKFFDFLRKIFKKKYRPPKEKTDDDESEESSEDESSSEASEGGAASDESREVEAVRMDENVLPVGCDEKLYDLSFTMRADRQLLEQTIFFQNKLKDEKARDIIDMRRGFKKSEEDYLETRENLAEFRRQKQHFLNNIEATVILKLDQMQYFRENESSIDLTNVLVFSIDNVIRLYKRVGELEHEALDTKRRHKINIIHLERMNTDCKFMRSKIKLLQRDIESALVRKFGMVIDVDELEESVLRRYVFEIQKGCEKEQRNFDMEIEKRKEILEQLIGNFNLEIQATTEKTSILTVLRGEKNFLKEILTTQAKLLEKSVEHIDFRSDVKRLSDIDKQQMEQLESVEREIRTLKYRLVPLQLDKKDSGKPPGLIEALPPEEQILIEEYGYIKSGFRSGPDIYISDKIQQVVKKFLKKHLDKQLTKDDIKKYSTSISKYLGFVANNFDCAQMDQVIECVNENFPTLLPKKYLLHITNNDIKTLFKNVVEAFNPNNIEINPEMLLNGIVANAIELSANLADLNVSQHIITEVFTEIIEVLTVDDLKKDSVINKLVNLLTNINNFKPKCINGFVLVENVLKHAKENLIEEFTRKPLNVFADTVIDRMIQKTLFND